MKVYIIGAGPGDERYLTDYARDLILDAGAVVTTPQLLEQFWHLNPNTVAKSVEDVPDAVLDLVDEQTNVCVLVSGDTGFFSAAKDSLIRLNAAGVELECVSGVSCLQHFANALGVNYEDAVNLCVSDCVDNIISYVCYNAKVFVLTNDQYQAHDVIKRLNTVGLGHVRVSVGQNLGAEDELIVTNTAKNLAALEFSKLAVLLIRNESRVNYWEVIDDDEFVRGQALMITQAVRRLALVKLNVNPNDNVLDIGAGNGSVSIEAARLAHRGRVFAFEKNTAALDLVKQNVKKFGAYNVTAMYAVAPEAFDALPVIDKAFIGGSDGKISEIIIALLANNPAVKIVVNAVTLETLNAAAEAFKAQGLAIDVICVNASVTAKTGAYHMLKAQDPAFIITAGGKVKE